MLSKVYLIESKTWIHQIKLQDMHVITYKMYNVLSVLSLSFWCTSRNVVLKLHPLIYIYLECINAHQKQQA